MSDAETELNLLSDEAEVVAFVRERDGHLYKQLDNPHTYWLDLCRRAEPTDRYIARLVWSSYPYAAPSVKFADAVGGNLNVTSAWPQIPGYRAESFDICQPFTQEGFALHPEWVTGPEAWDTSGNPFLRVVTQLQDDLDFRWQGRCP